MMIIIVLLSAPAASAAGAWDLCHIGHVRALAAAKKHCDFLIVGIHSDAVGLCCLLCLLSAFVPRNPTATEYLLTSVLGLSLRGQSGG